MKEEGCGGRYSAFAFFPCRLCLSKDSKKKCAETRHTAFEVLKKHEEYFSHPPKYGHYISNLEPFGV